MVKARLFLPRAVTLREELFTLLVSSMALTLDPLLLSARKLPNSFASIYEHRMPMKSLAMELRLAWD
jgi:hypothetical protein